MIYIKDYLLGEDFSHSTIPWYILVVCIDIAKQYRNPGLFQALDHMYWWAIMIMYIFVHIITHHYHSLGMIEIRLWISAMLYGTINSDFQT